MADVAILAPDGTPGSIPEENLKAAIAAGGKLAPTPEAPGLVPPEAHEPVAPGVDPSSAAKGFVAPVLLKDKATGEARPVDPNDVPKLLAAGSHEVANPDQPVQVVSPDGTLGEVPGGNLAEALKAGGRLPTDADLEGAGIRQQAKQDFGAGTTAALGLGGALQPLVDAVARRTGVITPEQQQQIEQVRDTAEEEHPAAYWAGRVPGEVATAIGTGDVAEGISGAAKLTGLAKVATEGAAYAIEPVATAIVNKDPAGAAEALALGVAGNIGLHAVFSLGAKAAGAVAERAASKVGEVASAEERRVAENTVLKAYGVPAAKREAAREMLPALHDAVGITSEDTEKTALQKLTKLEESGPRIGKAIEALDKADTKGELIFNAMAKSSDELKAVTARLVGEEADQSASALKPIIRQINEIAAKPEVGFTDTQGLKRFIGEQTNFGDNKLANRVRQEAYDVVRKNIMEAENAAAEKVGGSDVLEGLKADRATYTLHKFFGDFAERQASKEVDSGPHAFHLARHGLAAMAGHLIGLPAPVSVALSVGEVAARKALKGRVFGNAVKAVSGSTTPNTSLALDAIKALDSRVATGAKDLLSSLTSREVATHAAAIDPIGKLLPGGGLGQTHAQQVRALRTAVNQHQDNPAGVSDHLANLTAPLHDEGLAPVADAYTQHQLRLMKVIQSVLPADPKMAMPHPFAAEVKSDDIAPEVKARYERALTIATDPDRLNALVKSNTISQLDVAIAAATNPSTLQKMRDALVNEALKSKPDLSYQQRLSLSIMMGQNLDQSTAQLPVLQGAFTAPPPSGSVGKPPAKADELKGGTEMAEAFLPNSAKGIVSGR